MRANEANAEYMTGNYLCSGRDGTVPGENDFGGDEVRKNDSGRSAGATDVASELSPERIAEIREKILEGAYNSLESVDQLARRMLASGDL
jgi:negative regulator of flagellin synthesis FlgM